MLKINEKFQIREDDELNYGLYELKPIQDHATKMIRLEWKHIGYFGKVSHALSAAMNKYIKQMLGQEEYDCRRLLEKLAEIENDLTKIDIKHEPKIKPFKGINVKEKPVKATEAREPTDA